MSCLGAAARAAASMPICFIECPRISSCGTGASEAAVINKTDAIAPSRCLNDSADRVGAVSKQWFQIVAIWLGVALVGVFSVLNLETQQIYTVFAGLAAASIALVSVEHLISARAKDTVRQQVYVSAGSFAILGVLTLWVLLS
jgi:hypothetical protein